MLAPVRIDASLVALAPMSTNIAEPPDLLNPRSNQPELSVGDLARAIKGMLEGEFGRVRVRGEISGYKRAGSGHLYFRLKDDDAVLDAVCWRGAATKLGMVPEDGMEVIATGKITGYPSRSNYQIVVDQMEIAGEGALLKLLEDRKKKLAAEGLFAPERKQGLPFMPSIIGVITSPTGAVIRDILHRLRDRCPTHVLLWPVLVQGDASAEQVARAIHGFNALPADGSGRLPRPDLIIVARGGGSLEDLWAFNEEVVVRAAAESAIPLISAVGHETDTTLIDFASDRRAPTPTAAAEMAVPVLGELVGRLAELNLRLGGAARRGLDERLLRLERAERGLPEPIALVEQTAQRVDDQSERLMLALRATLVGAAQAVQATAGRLRHPREVLALKEQAVVASGRALDQAAQQHLRNGEHALARLDAGRRLPVSLTRRLDDGERRLAHASALLESYSYERVLDRGFVLVRGPEGPVTDAAQATPGLGVTLQFKDGESRGATIDGEAKKKAPAKPTKPKSAMQVTDNGQGRLL
jgi:exodeoxyribonuclease VII large subunit